MQRNARNAQPQRPRIQHSPVDSHAQRAAASYVRDSQKRRRYETHAVRSISLRIVRDIEAIAKSARSNTQQAKPTQALSRDAGLAIRARPGKQIESGRMRPGIFGLLRNCVPARLCPFRASWACVALNLRRSRLTLPCNHGRL